MHELSKEFSFESAHFLPHLPDGHKCKRLHGHSYRAWVTVKGPLDPILGWVIDTAEIKKSCAPIFKQLDHNFLNEIEGLENPTSEVIAQWLYLKIKPILPQLFQIKIAETCTTSVLYPT